MPDSRRVGRARAGLVSLALVGATVGACTGGSGPDPGPTGTAAAERPAVLEPWFDAARESDTGAANLVVLGDSVSEGYGLDSDLQRRWIDRLQAQLRQRSAVGNCPAGPAGWRGTTSLVPADYRAASLPDPTVGGPTAPAPGVGPGGRALTLLPGASVTWQVDAESVDIGYRTRFAGGPMQVAIDGLVPIDALAVPTDADQAGRRKVWSSGELGQGRHTVVVRNDAPAGSGRRVILTDLTPYRGDRGRCVHVLDASRSGVSAHTISQSPAYLKDSLSLEPDLLLVALGFNDRRAQIPAHRFGHSLDAIIERARSLGYDGPILLLGWYTPHPSTSGPEWSGYLQQMRERNSRPGVSFIDLSAVLPPVRASSAYYIDALHPSAAGHQRIADSLIEALVPRVEAVATPTEP